MKHQFVKLFSFEHHQVLVTRTVKHTEDGEHYLMTFSTQLEGLLYTNEHGFMTEVARDLAFENVDHIIARSFLDTGLHFEKQ
jgi:hypothetical protein